MALPTALPDALPDALPTASPAMWPAMLSALLLALLPAASASAQTDVATVYAVGDIALCSDHDPRWSGAFDTAAVLASALASDPAAVVLTLGDHTYPRGAATEFANCYAPTWGRFKARTWPTPGNHEYYTAQAAPYFAYFGARAGSGHYRLVLGSWRVYSLNSNLKGAADAAQLAWLRTQLEQDQRSDRSAPAAAAAPCTLAFWHHPLYSSGGHGNVATMRAAWELLQAAGAELVLSGHDHDYERFAPQDSQGRPDPRGLRQFVVGTGGAYPTPFLWPRAHSEVRDASRNGVLRLRLEPGAYSWEFLEATEPSLPNASPPDRGSARCH